MLNKISFVCFVSLVLCHCKVQNGQSNSLKAEYDNKQSQNSEVDEGEIKKLDVDNNELARNVLQALIDAQAELANSKTHPDNFYLSDKLEYKFREFFINDRQLKDGGNGNVYIFKETESTLAVYFSNSSDIRTTNTSAATARVYIYKSSLTDGKNSVYYNRYPGKK